MADLGIKVKLTPDGQEKDFQTAVDNFKVTAKIGIDKAFLRQSIKEALNDKSIQSFTIPLKTVIDTKRLSADLKRALAAIDLENSGGISSGSKKNGGSKNKGFKMSEKQIISYQKQLANIEAKRKKILESGLYDKNLMSGVGNDIANIKKL